MHIVISTGGTGGHVFPALAVAEEVHRRGAAVTLVVAAHRVIQEQYSVEHPGFATQSISAARLPSSKLQLPFFGVRFVRTWFEARRVLGRIHPDVVLGMGSFASVPAGLAAVSRGTPLFLHEGNALLGKANRLLCRWARHLATALPVNALPDRRCPTSITGFPVRGQLRQDIAALVDRTELLRRFNLEAGRLTVLVFGGSQGAGPINDLMLAVPDLLRRADRRCQFIHLTGSDQNAARKAQYANAGFPYWISGWTDTMADCYRAADLVVCRAGASTIAELTLAGKPAVLIPLPAAANDHQTANAHVLAERNAAICLPQPQATPDALVRIIGSLEQDREAWETRVHNLRQLAHPRAAEALADMIMDATASRQGQGRLE